MFSTYVVASSAVAVMLGSHYIVHEFPVTRAAVRPSSVDGAIDSTLALQTTTRPVVPVPQLPPPPPDSPKPESAAAAQKNPTCSPNPISVPTNGPRVYRGPDKRSAPAQIVYVRPEYPEDARVKRVQGVVVLEAQIERDGRVCSARVLRSIALLDQSAIDAVFRWRFTPATVNDVAVPVITTLTVNFTLPQ